MVGLTPWIKDFSDTCKISLPLPCNPGSDPSSSSQSVSDLDSHALWHPQDKELRLQVQGNFVFFCFRGASQGGKVCSKM